MESDSGYEFSRLWVARKCCCSWMLKIANRERRCIEEKKLSLLFHHLEAEYKSTPLIGASIWTVSLSITPRQVYSLNSLHWPNQLQKEGLLSQQFNSNRSTSELLDRALITARIPWNPFKWLERPLKTLLHLHRFPSPSLLYFLDLASIQTPTKHIPTTKDKNSSARSELRVILEVGIRITQTHL